MKMQYTDYVAGWAVVIQSLDPAWGWAVVSRAWIPSQLRAWVAWQWLSRALDPASLRRACVLGGRIQSHGSRRSGTRLGGAGQWLSRAWILPRAGRWYPEPGSRPSGARGGLAVVIQSLGSCLAVCAWGAGRSYPEPWIPSQLRPR